MHTTTPVDEGKAAMRGLIHTVGIAKATAQVADTYAAPGNDTERETLAGIILAAYEAGQLDGAAKAWMEGV